MSRDTFARSTAFGATVFALVVAACGGASPLTKSQFDAKANGICKRYTGQINAVPTPKSIEDVPAYVTRVKPFIERGVDELAGLKPPRHLKATYDQWLRTQRDALHQVDELRGAAQRNDLLGVNRTITQLRERNARGNALAAQLGARVCAKS
jgi:hypothetical protein